jgi:ketosteroid isomerase-like protein
VTEEELLLTYVRAWNAHDADACARCYAPDGVREYRLLRPCDPLLGRAEPLIGREEIAADVARVLESVPDLRIEVLSAAYSSDRRLWSEWRATGSPRDGGRGVAIVGVSVFRLRNEGFTEERLYWDSALHLGAARP